MIKKNQKSRMEPLYVKAIVLSAIQKVTSVTNHTFRIKKYFSRNQQSYGEKVLDFFFV